MSDRLPFIEHRILSLKAIGFASGGHRFPVPSAMGRSTLAGIMPHNPLRWVTILLLAATQGCGVPLGPPPPTQAAPLVPQVAASLPPPTTAPPPPPPPTSTLPFTPTPMQPCPIAPSNPPLPEVVPFEAVIPRIVDYLNAGGSLQALTKHLSSSGILVDETRDLMAPDLNGDRLQDFAIVLLDPTASMPFEKGVLAVAVCAGDNLRLAMSEAPAAEPSFPSLAHAQDLTGDGRDDLLVSWKECGAHTCYERLQVLVQREQTLEDRIQGDSRDLPNPVIDILWTPGRPAQIRMAGTGFGSVGAGPYRPQVRIWSWDDAAGYYRVTEESVEPSAYRIHALIDADQAALSGDFAQAAMGYDRVINDPTLLAWGDPDIEYRILSAYARYRRVLLSLQLGDEVAAREALTDMTEAGDLSDVESPFLELAQVLWEAYVQAGDLESACASAQALVTDPGSDIISRLDFGYANPSYTAYDICPIGAP